MGEVELARLCDIDGIDLPVTDSSANTKMLDALRERDLKIIYVR